MNPRESFYREEFNILRASIIGDPSPAQIVELGNLIQEENRSRGEDPTSGQRKTKSYLRSILDGEDVDETV